MTVKKLMQASRVSNKFSIEVEDRLEKSVSTTTPVDIDSVPMNLSNQSIGLKQTSEALNI